MWAVVDRPYSAFIVSNGFFSSLLEHSEAMNDFAANDCQGRPNFLQHLVRHGEVVVAQDGEVCKEF